PRHGPAALSNAQTMTNLLKDMLPDAPRESSVLVAASEVGVAGLLQSNISLIIWACALPDLHIPAGNGRTSFSIFNSGVAGDLWFAVEPVGVAVIGVAAALIIMLADRSARMRLVAGGVLIGFGIQTILLFAGYEFYVQNPDHAGPGGAVGILGGLLLLAAG